MKNTHVEKTSKRIFNTNMANYLLSKNIKLIEVRIGEVLGKPERPTFLFKNDAQLIKAMNDYRSEYKQKI